MITLDKEVALEYAMLDIGSILQSICLLAHDKGLGTCIMAVSIYYPEISRKLLDISDSKRIVIGAALGWPDPEAPINQFERERGGIETFLSFKS